MAFGAGESLASGERKRRITPARISEFIDLISGLPIVVDEETPQSALGPILELSRGQQLSAYDASYLELAMRRGAPLATKDRTLANAAERMGVALLPTT